MRLAFGTLAFLLLATAAGQPTARNLGTPVKSMTIWGGLLVRDRGTGRPVYYSGTYTTTGWARLIRFDYAENKTEYYPLPGTKGAYGLCEGPDGRIYIGTVDAGRIFSFDPVTRQVTDLGSAAGEQYVWTLHSGPDGRIYGATYPNAKVVVYDPRTGRIEDLGRMHPTEQYCRDLAVADNGKVFCGIGSRADIVVYDPSTGEKRSILPDRYKGNSFAYTMDSEDNIVYAFLHFDQIVLIFDAETYELLMEVRHPEGQGVYIFRQISGGPVLITNLPGGYMRFNKATRQLEPYETGGYGYYDALTGVAYSGDSQVFQARNVTSGKILSSVNVGKDGEGMAIFSLGTGPDGCIYGGVYNLLHLFRYDPASGDLVDLGIPIPGASGEFYSFLEHEGKLYMASYTYSVLSVYDPSKPWAPGTSKDSNPRKIGPVGDEQYRPPAMVAGADGKVYIGSIPAYGKFGGALSSYDPATDAFEVHRHIVPNQSIVSLTASLDRRTIFGGSSIYGDYATPIEKEAHFFAWDTQRGCLVLDLVPVAGASQIQSLATAPDGKVYGFAGSTLFIYDPATNQIVHKQSVPVGAPTKTIAGRDGLIYGISSASLFRLKPISRPGEEIGIEQLYSGGVDLAFGHDGRIYFARGTDLFVLENVPSCERPRADLKIYQDGLEPDWGAQSTRATVELSSTDYVNQGTCQKVTFSGTGILQYFSPDPWAVAWWEYEYLLLSVNPGTAILTDIQITKTGTGAGKAVSILKTQSVTLAPGQWTRLYVPVSDMGWVFGSRVESLKIIVTGAGTIYLDDIALAISEVGLAAAVLPLCILCRQIGKRSRIQGWAPDRF